MKKIILITVALFASSYALELECEFISREMNQLSETYACYMPQLSKIDESRSVTGVSGTHIPGKTNADVGLLFIRGETNLTYFPENIESFFPNLIAIGIDFCDIESLNGNEIEAFPNLVWFVLNFHPQLIRIPPNLFSNNPHIHSIWFSGNSINHIGQNLLSGLSELSWVSFLNNTCIHQIAMERSEIASVIQTIEENCEDIEVTTTELTPPSTSTTSESSTSDSTTDLPNLPPTCDDLNESVCELKSQNQLLIDENIKMNSQIEELNVQIAAIAQDNESIHQKLDAILEGVQELATRPCVLQNELR